MNFIKSLIYNILEAIFPGIYKEIKEENINKKNYNYSVKRYLTLCENNFYQKLKEIEKYGDYICLPQINLASIISKNSKYRNELFRNIDFGIFNNDYEILLLIELNDNSHKYKSRRKRDIKVQNICKNVGIKLITFYTNYPNEKNYIIKRVLNTIKED